VNYTITQVSPQLYFIQWRYEPTANMPEVERLFIADLRQRLEEAQHPIYYLSDLRKGRITNVKTLRELSEITQHEKWGGGTAFTQDSFSSILAKVFSTFVRYKNRNYLVWDSPEKALAYLETLQPGLTKNIDWNPLLNPK
jgi:hypothetical protein